MSAASSPAPVPDRLDELERQVRDLRARIAVLERALGARDEHPADETVVRRKVTYDWQT